MNKRDWCVLIFALGLCCGPVIGQSRVPPEFMYYRVYAVVPMIGDGKKDNPKRPMFVPSADEAKAKAAKGPDRSGVIAYQMQVSDDGKSALVEFVFATPQAARAFAQSNTPGVKAFLKGNSRKDDVEAEFKKYKRDFDLNSFGRLAAQ